LIILLASVYAGSPAILTERGFMDLDARSQNRPLSPPLDEMLVTGTMGEFRPAHFHYGLDLSTGGKTGLPVYSVDDGYVSRIMYGRYSIGRGIFIVHPDNRQSKYGHLDSFADEILTQPTMQPLLEKIKMREEFDFYPPAGSIPIKRGQQIALSGESGIGFPHLHFEYIDGNKILNPLTHGLYIEDRTAPVITDLTIGPAHPESRINGEYIPVTLNVEPVPVANTPAPTARESNPELEASKNNAPIITEYRLKGAPDLRIAGAVHIQPGIYDPSGRSRLGLNDGELLVNNQRVFAFQFNQLPLMAGYNHFYIYDLSRSRIFYGTRYTYNFFERRSGALPNVQVRHAGQVRAAEAEKSLTVLIRGRDSNANEARLSFQLVSDGTKYDAIDLPEPNAHAGDDSELVSADSKFHVQFKASTLFEDRHFKIQNTALPALPAGMRAVSAAYQMEPTYLDFSGPFRIRLAGQETARVGIYAISNRPRPLGSSYVDGAYQVDYRTTGTFALLQDNAAPVFYPVRQRAYRGNFRLLIYPRDSGSGIDPASAAVYVDGKECRVEHDPDRGALEVFHPDHIYRRGNHTLVARIRDRAGNLSERYVYNYTVY
ncbi:MAG: M23 family metallopeptidase, partial [Leptospiraceae bacterium]|nr:M23 family metallopeptidase [Leptospiraceae bacterium]